MTRRATPAVSDGLIAEARNTAGFSGSDYRYLITRLADALEQAETQLATVRRSADAWWSAYNEEHKRAHGSTEATS